MGRLLIASLIAVTIGISLGLLERKAKQKQACPVCTCRSECNIGIELETGYSNNGFIPMACKLTEYEREVVIRLMEEDNLSVEEALNCLHEM